MTFTIPIQKLGGLQVGSNSIVFTFNGTEGTSSGYRILKINFLGSNGYKLFEDKHFSYANPDNWHAPEGSNIKNGARLWKKRHLLQSSPGKLKQLKASCADCHEAAGADLEYYSYSNASIIGRGVFHGLTRQEGKDIAAYIRSNPAKRYGRPWNPPYQPGNLIDSTVNAAEKWAAGAGLEAVTKSEFQNSGDTFKRMVPKQVEGPYKIFEIVQAYAGKNLPQNTHSIRKQRLSIQLPDWNDWLPEVHPIDMWGPL